MTVKWDGKVNWEMMCNGQRSGRLCIMEREEGCQFGVGKFLETGEWSRGGEVWEAEGPHRNSDIKSTLQHSHFLQKNLSLSSGEEF